MVSRFSAKRVDVKNYFTEKCENCIEGNVETKAVMLSNGGADGV
jgi:hypothetical protein